MYHSSVKRIYSDPNAPEVWLARKSDFDDSYTLLTISDSRGEKTVLLAGDKVVETKARHFVQAPKERQVTGNDKLRREASKLVKFFGYTLMAVLMTFSLLSFAGIAKARIVLTESMKPSIQPGDIVLSLSPDRLPPKVGDVVTYTARRFDGSEVASFTHRIISGDAKAGFVVKGDNNPAPDTQKPKLDDISGVVFYTVPIIGKLLTPRGLMVLIPCIFGLWLIIDSMKNDK